MRLWNKKTGREFIENLFNQRINFHLVVLSLVMTGILMTHKPEERLVVIAVGLVLCALLGLSLYRACHKLLLILKCLHRTKGHPVRLSGKLARRRRWPVSGPVNHITGIWLPIVTILIWCALLVGTLVTGWSSLPTGAATQGRIALKFEPVSVENLPPGKPNPAWRLAKTVRYWPAKDHPGATIDLYMEDSWNVHAFLQSKAGYLNLGEVGLASPDVKVTATNWERDGVQLGRNIITIEGSIGADCAVLVILGFDPLDRQWKLLAHIEGTDIERTDLEPRGPDVIVSMFGDLDATLYRWKGCQFEQVDLGKAVTRHFGRPFYVDAGSIVDARTFRCGPIVEGGLSKPTKFYDYNDGALIEVKPKNKSKAR